MPIVFIVFLAIILLVHRQAQMKGFSRYQISVLSDTSICIRFVYLDVIFCSFDVFNSLI